MGPIESLQFARLFRSLCCRGGWLFFLCLIDFGWVFLSPLQAQKPLTVSVATETQTVRARRFLGGRTLASDHLFAAQAMDAARSQHAAMLKAMPRDSSLSTAWQPLGPAQVASAAYGSVTGRVTAVAIDPADATGNTVYLGTTGGGVWKSINAAGPAASVSFTPLTDTLPVFSPNAESVAVPSLSIGAVSVQSGVILAGTGDPNDASDSFYGSGLLRSSDGGLTWTLIRNSHDGVGGNHSFDGLGFAGFAWSNPTTVCGSGVAGCGRYAGQCCG
jgi:hypothetical protein